MKVVCPYCRKEARCIDSIFIYKTKSYGYMWFCDCVKDFAYVGCKKGTAVPMGTLANKNLRRWRKVVHITFDSLWNGKNERLMSRDDAYSWLSQKMGISSDRCHIAMFNEDQCWKAYTLSLEKLREELICKSGRDGR